MRPVRRVHERRLHTGARAGRSLSFGRDVLRHSALRRQRLLALARGGAGSLRAVNAPGRLAALVPLLAAAPARGPEGPGSAPGSVLMILSSPPRPRAPTTGRGTRRPVA